MAKVEQLIRLIQEARVIAGDAGPAARVVVRSLDEALLEAQALAGGTGKPDEGTRPEKLSSANDG